MRPLPSSSHLAKSSSIPYRVCPQVPVVSHCHHLGRSRLCRCLVRSLDRICITSFCNLAQSRPGCSDHSFLAHLVLPGIVWLASAFAFVRSFLRMTAVLLWLGSARQDSWKIVRFPDQALSRRFFGLGMQHTADFPYLSFMNYYFNLFYDFVKILDKK